MEPDHFQNRQTVTHLRNCILLLFAFLFTSLSFAQDSIVEIKPFYGADGKLLPYSSGYLDQLMNYEMKPGDLYRIAYSKNRGFVTFDLTSLPPGVIIKTALIKFTIGDGGNYAGNVDYATVTGLSNSTINGLISKADVETGPVYADKLFWGGYPGVPAITSDMNAAGIAAIQKRIGAGFTVGFNPANNSEIRTLTAPRLVITYEPSTAQPKPVADFSAFKEAYKRDEIRFTDNSSYYPTQWFWDFGDGATSTDRNPTHVYADTGTYTVKLRVANASGSDSIQKVNYMKISSKPDLEADFEVTELETYVNVPVTFYDRSSNDPVSWHWDFGDGATSDFKDPSHGYAELGLYTVSLIARKQYTYSAYPYSSIYVEDTVIKPKYINVIDPSKGPFAWFGVKKIAGRTVTFGDSSYNVPATWSWDLDATNNPGMYTSQVQNPVFTYPAYGTYTACLIVSNDVGKDTICREIEVADPATGVAASPEKDIRLFPNPAGDIVYIRLPDAGNLTYTITFHNMLGETVSKRIINDYTGILPYDVSGLPRGCYFLTIKNDHINKSAKLILNR